MQIFWYDDQKNVSNYFENIHVLGVNEIIRPKIPGAQSASQYYKIPILNNFKAYRNYIGIKNDVRGEYCQLNGCIAGENHIGYFTGGGNNMASNCQFNRNQNGAKIVGGVTDGVSYPNNSHASFTGCQFNHKIDESIRFENCGTIFEKKCFLAAVDASTEICIDILAKNYLPEIINLNGVKYASIPVKKQFSTHVFFVAGVNRGASSSEAGMAYGRISATNNFAYFSDRTPSLEQKITLNTNSINCELVICQDYK